jgi:hypothetical protein
MNMSIRIDDGPYASSPRPATGTSVSKTRDHGRAAGGRARRAALIVEIFGWFVAIGGTVAGIILAAQSETTYGTFNEYKDYPYVGYGIGLAAASIVNAAAAIMVAAYIQWRVKSASAR